MFQIRRQLVVLGVICTALLGAAAQAETQKSSWEQPPGPIAGKWKLNCETRGAMVIAIELKSDKKAVGKIVEIGDGARFGYTVGDEILQLEADDYGDWVGRLSWRSINHDLRSDPIRLVATKDKLNATMTTDPCYKDMLRVP